MNHDTLTDEQKRIMSAVHIIFTELHARTNLSILDVTYWLGMHINMTSKAFTGESGYSTGGFKLIDIDVIETEDCTNLVTTVQWSLNGSGNGLPDVTKLSELIRGITLLPQQITGNSKTLKLKIIHNVDIWNNLVPCVLYWLLSTKNDTQVSNEKKEIVDGKISLLLTKYFPNIDTNVLNIAADLGMLEGEPTFTDWVTQYVNRPDVTSVILPVDLS